MKNHFKQSEFRCKGKNCCGGVDVTHPELKPSLEMLRALVCFKLREDTPLTITSGFRCKTHNSRIGGALNSQHFKGTAADIATPKGLTDEEFFQIAKELELDGVKIFGGVGLYNGRIHVDVRDGKQKEWSV